jgi:DNA-binding transcriptional LysR family regulator
MFKRTVRLTDAGEAFLDPCRESLRAMDAGKQPDA